MFRPLNDSVVVEPCKPVDKLGGIMLSDNAKNYSGLRAVVLAVGPGLFTLTGTRLPIDVKEGDIVILRSGGQLINEGKRVVSIVCERDILAVVEGGPAVRPYKESEHTPAVARN